MNLKKIINNVNVCVDFLNKEELTKDELIAVLSQLLIAVGRSMYDPENKILGKDIDWISLNREYYEAKNPNNGLGLMLNGASMMSVISDKLIDENGEKNDQISTSKLVKSKKPQKRKNNVYL